MQYDIYTTPPRISGTISPDRISDLRVGRGVGGRLRCRGRLWRSWLRFGDKEEEGNLRYVGFLEMAWYELVGYEVGDEVVFGLGEAFVYEGVDVGEERGVGLGGIGGGCGAVAADSGLFGEVGEVC
jgi:hypothetical protein